MDNAIAWNDLFGADLAIVAQLERRMLMRFVARNDIKSLADAAKLPIAVDATTNGFVLVLYRALARAGIDWRSCTFDEVGGVKHRFDAMMEGRATSTILVPPFDDMAIAKGCNPLWSVDDIAPVYPGVVIAARRTFLREQPEAAHALPQCARSCQRLGRDSGEQRDRTSCADRRALFAEISRNPGARHRAGPAAFDRRLGGDSEPAPRMRLDAELADRRRDRPVGTHQRQI